MPTNGLVTGAPAWLTKTTGGCHSKHVHRKLLFRRKLLMTDYAYLQVATYCVKIPWRALLKIGTVLTVLLKTYSVRCVVPWETADDGLYTWRQVATYL